MPGVPTLSTQWPAIGGVGYKLLIILCHQRGHSKKMENWEPWGSESLCSTMPQWSARPEYLGTPKRKESQRIFWNFRMFHSTWIEFIATSWELNVPLPSRTGTKDFMKDKAPDTQQAHFVLLQFHIPQCSHKFTAGKWRKTQRPTVPSVPAFDLKCHSTSTSES